MKKLPRIDVNQTQEHQSATTNESERQETLTTLTKMYLEYILCRALTNTKQQQKKLM